MSQTDRDKFLKEEKIRRAVSMEAAHVVPNLIQLLGNRQVYARLYLEARDEEQKKEMLRMYEQIDAIIKTLINI